MTIDNPFLTANALLAEPATLIQNGFAHWRMLSLVSDDYDAYRYEYRFKRDDDKSGKVYTVPVDADGYATVTPNWPAGTYRYTLYLVRQSDSAAAPIKTGRVTLRPDLSTAVDGRTHAEIMLAKIESLIEGRADSDVESYTIGNRQITKMKMSELASWRTHYQAEVAAQQRTEAGVSGGGYIRVRFV